MNFLEIFITSLYLFQLDIAKRICTKKFHRLTSESFFQRTELKTAEACVESCIESIEYCKSAVFILEKNKNKGLCELYRVNSQSFNVTLPLDRALNPASTVFEVLDECPFSTLSNDVLEKIDPELKEKFISWSKNAQNYDQRLHAVPVNGKASTDTSTASGTHLVKNEGNTDWLIQRMFFEGQKVPREGAFTEQKVQKYSGEERRGTSIPHRRYLGSELRTDRYLSPIQPSQVYHGTSSCKGANCYSPAITVPQSNPCSPTIPYLPCPTPLVNPCATIVPMCPMALMQPQPRLPLPQPYQPIPQTYVKPSVIGMTLRPQERPQVPVFPPDKVIYATSAPVEYTWSEWSPSTACSVTCGRGVALKKRFCSETGKCTGESVKEEPCETIACEEDIPSGWSTWSSWSACSKSCEGGEQERYRTCQNNKNDCIGPSMAVQACNSEECPVWSSWGEWEQCSVTCGIGKKKRFRQCINGLACVGRPYEEKDCEAKPCPVWTQWLSWSDCSKTCGSGEQIRRRNCDGDVCEGDREERKFCNSNICPEWTPWTQWSECSKTCGDAATKLRTRNCFYNNARSSLCEGAAQDQTLCKLPLCPEWIEWSSWSECSTSCGHGQQFRTRKCTPEGLQCPGGHQEVKFCQLAVCPYWSQWSTWSTCSVTCGYGISERIRKCFKDDIAGLPNIDEIISQVKGEDAKSAAKATLIVSSRNKQKSQELKNTSTFFVRRRDEPEDIRVIQDGESSPSLHKEATSVLASTECMGPGSDRKRCFAGPCCELGQWTFWTPCSVTCGQGRRRRSRSCSSSDTNEQRFNENQQKTRLRPYQPSVFSQPQNLNLLQKNYRTPQRQAVFISPIYSGVQPIIPVKPSLPRHEQFFPGGFIDSSRGTTPGFRDNSECHCDGATFEEEDCNLGQCVSGVVGGGVCSWSQWSEWCGCSGPCNMGSRLRSRYCNRPRKQYRTICQCQGESIQSSPCIPSNCLPNSVQNRENQYRVSPEFSSQMDSPNEKVPNGRATGCGWSDWSAWSYCAGSRRTRTRSCIGVSLSKIRCECSGPIIEQIHCTIPSMDYQIQSKTAAFSPVKILNQELEVRNPGTSCSWLEWGAWSACSASCNKGDMIRKRDCPCRSCEDGIATELRICELEKCDDSGSKRPNPFD